VKIKPFAREASEKFKHIWRCPTARVRDASNPGPSPPLPFKLAQPHSSSQELLPAKLSALRKGEMILLHSKSRLENRELYIRTNKPGEEKSRPSFSQLE